MDDVSFPKRDHDGEHTAFLAQIIAVPPGQPLYYISLAAPVTFCARACDPSFEAWLYGGNTFRSLSDLECQQCLDSLFLRSIANE